MSEIFLYEKTIKKNVKKSMWFYAPMSESFALSSLGYLWLYKLIDELPYIDIERVYTDSKTTRIYKQNVDIIAFSMSFDFDFLSVFDFFKKNNYEIKAKDRNETSPLFFAGGPVITSNPTLYNEIFDFMIIGDGEETNISAINLICNSEYNSKNEVLEALSKIDGVYVPKFSKKIIKSTYKTNNCVYTPIISDKSFFQNTFVIEVERGCANRCAFCLASYINLPIRFPSLENIITDIELGLKYTNKIALLGAQVTAHPKFVDLCKYLENKIDNGIDLEVSVSSLRVDSFTDEIVSFLVKAKQRNLTLAIEAGTDRLRKVINKNLNEQQIFKAINVARNCGLKGLKFYAMLGLPTETDEDIKGFVELAKKIRLLNKGFDISFGFSSFVPKPNTPFQWCGREDNKSIEVKINYLKKEFHKLGIEASFPSVKWDYYQALLSRGNSSLTDYLIKVYELGGKIGAFKKAAKDLNIDTNKLVLTNYDFDDKLPWDLVEISPGKKFLINEINKLLNI